MKWNKNAALLLTAVLLADTHVFGEDIMRDQTDDARLNIVRVFADNVLEAARDRWSGRNTPLLADGVNIDTREPAVWRYQGEEYIIHNLANQQNLFRTLTALSNLTGEERYKNAAKDAIRYHFDNLVSDCGLLRWGGHQFVDLRTLQPVGRFDVNRHEFKNNFPYYELMWEVDPEATARFLRAFWNAHVLDWRNLDMNRHGDYGKQMGKPWESEFEQPEPFFEGKGLTFINCGTDLIYAGYMLYMFAGEEGARIWAERLAEQYVRARHPKTGLGVYQYSKPRREQQPPVPMNEGRHTWSSYGDRAENQFAGQFGEVAREGWVMWGSRVRSIYATNGIVQLTLAEKLGDEGSQLLSWTVDGIKALLKHAYDPEKNSFRPMWADGTDLTGQSITNFGYYNQTGRDVPFEPLPADSSFLVAYARAFRLTQDAELWQAVRQMSTGNGLGDPGEKPGVDPALNMNTDCADHAAVFAMLELYRITEHPDYLQLARKLADNLVEQRFRNGFFLPSGLKQPCAANRTPCRNISADAATFTADTTATGEHTTIKQSGRNSVESN